ncbi:IS200/IS605 family transposase, partial [Salmonella enterica]|nr:IS200/IS605 family transposase [Salmonella enterica]
MRSGNCKSSTRNQKGVPMGDEKSLAHIRWNCKYHIVF